MGVLGQQALHLGAQLLRPVFIRVHAHDPLGVDACVFDGPVELGGVVAIGLMLEDVRAQPARDVQRGVRAAAVHHYDAPGNALEPADAGGDVLLLVPGQYDGGQVGH